MSKGHPVSFFLFGKLISPKSFPWCCHLVPNLQKLSEIRVDNHRDVRERVQSVYCMFVCVKILTLSLRVAVTWCCLDSSPRLLSPETCLCSNPSILFTAPLHPYRTNDHGSGQLLNAVVSSVLFSDSSSIALDGTQMYLLHMNPPTFSTSTNVVFEHLSKGVLDVCHITFTVCDYRQGPYHFSLLMILSNFKV